MEHSDSMLTEYLGIRTQVEKSLRDSKPHPFARFLLEKFKITEKEFAHFILKKNADFANSLEGGRGKKDFALIPNITHRVWITDLEDPHLPPDRYIKEIAASYIDNEDWSNFFWTNVPQVAESLRKTFQDAGASVDVLLLKDAFSGDQLLIASNDYLKDKKFVGASDLIRFMVLKKFGGLYADLGVKYSKQLLEIIKNSGAVINIDSTLLLQLAFLAFPPESRFINLWTKICVEPHRLTAALYPPGQQFSAIEELSFLSGPGFTTIATLFFDSNTPTLIVPQQGKHLQISSQKSWYGQEGKFGNVIVSKTHSTRLLTSQHDQFISSLGDSLLETKSDSRRLLLRNLTE